MTFWRFALAGLVALVPSVADAQDCGLKEYTSIDLLGDTQHQPVVAVNIAGKPFHLIVDTAGVYSELSSDVVSALSLDTHEIRNGDEIYTAKGAALHRYVDAQGFEIGKLHLDHFPMIVGDRVSEGIDGTLSVDFLDRFDVDFDFAAKKMNLFSPDHCEGKVVYWAKTYADAPFKVENTHVQIAITLDGHDLTGVVDTGSSLSTIDEKTSANVLGVDTTSPGIEHDASAKPGDPLSYRYRFKSLSLSGIAVSNPDLLILPDLAERAFEKRHDDEKSLNDPIYGEHLQKQDVILGMDVLSKLHLYISYKEKKLYFTAADAH